MGTKLYIKTYGCQMNEYDSDKTVDILKEKKGVELTNDVKDDELRNIYNQKPALSREPEKKDIKQIKFISFDQANHARKKLLQGADFQIIAKQYSPEFALFCKNLY